MNVGNGLSNLGNPSLASSNGMDGYTQLRSLSEDRELNTIVSRGLDVMDMNNNGLGSTTALVNSVGNFSDASNNGKSGMPWMHG